MKLLTRLPGDEWLLRLEEYTSPEDGSTYILVTANRHDRKVILVEIEEETGEVRRTHGEYSETPFSAPQGW